MIPTTDQKKQLTKKLSDISKEIKEVQVNEKEKLESEKEKGTRLAENCETTRHTGFSVLNVQESSFQE